MKGENCLVVFNLGHFDNSVCGVLSDTGVQGPPLYLFSGHNLPALYSVNCLEACSWSNSFIFRNILPSECWKIKSADKMERWSMQTSVAEHATNGVVKMTQIEDYKVIFTSHFFSFLWSSQRKCSSSCWQYSRFRCGTSASVGTTSLLAGANVSTPSRTPLASLMTVSWLSHDCLMTGS